jgi:hypothetical protein
LPRPLPSRRPRQLAATMRRLIEINKLIQEINSVLYCGTFPKTTIISQ